MITRKHGPKESTEYDLVFYSNRSTPEVVVRGREPNPKSGYGKQTKRRAATEEETKVIRRGDWLRVDAEGNKPSSKDYKTTKYRPWLSKKAAALAAVHTLPGAQKQANIWRTIGSILKAQPTAAAAGAGGGALYQYFDDPGASASKYLTRAAAGVIPAVMARNPGALGRYMLPEHINHAGRVQRVFSPARALLSTTAATAPAWSPELRGRSEAFNATLNNLLADYERASEAGQSFTNFVTKEVAKGAFDAIPQQDREDFVDGIRRQGEVLAQQLREDGLGLAEGVAKTVAEEAGKGLVPVLGLMSAGGLVGSLATRLATPKRPDKLVTTAEHERERRKRNDMINLMTMLGATGGGALGYGLYLKGLDSQSRN